MLGMEEWMEVKELKRQGHSIKEICRRTSDSRNTVRKILREAGPIRRATTPIRTRWVSSLSDTTIETA
jgi:transposase